LRFGRTSSYLKLWQRNVHESTLKSPKKLKSCLKRSFFSSIISLNLRTHEPVGMGIGFLFFFDIRAKPVLLKRYRCLSRYFKKKKRSAKRQLTMTTLKTFSTVFPVKAVLMEHWQKNGCQTVTLVARAILNMFIMANLLFVDLLLWTQDLQSTFRYYSEFRLLVIIGLHVFRGTVSPSRPASRWQWNKVNWSARNRLTGRSHQRSAKEKFFSISIGAGTNMCVAFLSRCPTRWTSVTHFSTKFVTPSHIHYSFTAVENYCFL